MLQTRSESKSRPGRGLTGVEPHKGARGGVLAWEMCAGAERRGERDPSSQTHPPCLGQCSGMTLRMLQTSMLHDPRNACGGDPSRCRSKPELWTVESVRAVAGKGPKATAFPCRRSRVRPSADACFRRGRRGRWTTAGSDSSAGDCARRGCEQPRKRFRVGEVECPVGAPRAVSASGEMLGSDDAQPARCSGVMPEEIRQLDTGNIATTPITRGRTREYGLERCHHGGVKLRSDSLS